MAHVSHICVCKTCKAYKIQRDSLLIKRPLKKRHLRIKSLPPTFHPGRGKIKALTGARHSIAKLSSNAWAGARHPLAKLNSKALTDAKHSFTITAQQSLGCWRA